MNPIIKTEINFKEICSSELFEYMSWKEEFPLEAEKAFVEFVYRFERDVIQKAEIYCSKFSYSEAVAMEIAHCTFARVLKYPTFDIKKAKGVTIDASVKIWLYRIMYTQIVKYGDKNTCSEPTEEEDLSLICGLDDYIGKMGIDGVEEKKAIKMKLNFLTNALANLSEKHKIIYFTYKAYEIQNKNIPRSVTKQLQETLQLTQSSIRVYKKDAYLQVENYIKQNNVKK